MGNKDQFIVNGRQKHFEALKEQIANRVWSKYKDKLLQPGFFKRICIRYRIWREIQDELKKYSPPSEESLFLNK